MKLFLFIFLAISPYFILSLKAENHALVIGIHYDYLRPEQQIPECAKDAQAIHQILLGKYQFSANNISLLKSREATKEAITRKFQELIGKSKRGDKVFIYYSGHGTSVPDENGDEKDGKDEAICTYDENIILDDDLGAWINRIAERKADVVVLFDSCHSGTGIKGASLLPSANRYYRSKYLPCPIKKSAGKEQYRDTLLVRRNNSTSSCPSSGDSTILDESHSQGRVVFYSGCADQESSYTLGQVGYSTFTYHLLRAFENNLQADADRNGIITFEEMFQFVLQSVRRETSPAPQNPTMEGEGNNQFYPALFGVTKPSSPSPEKPDQKISMYELLERLMLQHLCTYADESWKLELKIKPDRSSLAFGEYIQVSVKANQSGYLLLLNVTEKGSATLLFPNAEKKNNYLEAGDTLLIPPSCADWAIQAQPPAGREWIVAYLFSTNPLDGYDLGDTFEENFLLGGKIESKYSHSLKKETQTALLQYLTQTPAKSSQEIVKSWTKAAVEYTTHSK